jgi:hypothetical protein
MRGRRDLPALSLGDIAIGLRGTSQRQTSTDWDGGGEGICPPEAPAMTPPPLAARLRADALRKVALFLPIRSAPEAGSNPCNEVSFFADGRRGEKWWRRRDLNPRPPRCERGALPAELLPHLEGTYFEPTGAAVSNESHPTRRVPVRQPPTSRLAPPSWGRRRLAGLFWPDWIRWSRA